LPRINAFVDRCLEVFVGLNLGLLVFITFGQVVGRYVFGHSFGWAEELCTLIFCWTVWPTACLLLRSGRHLNVTLLLNRFSGPTRRQVNLGLRIIILALLGLLIYGGFGAMEAMADISFVTMPLPNNVKFVSVPVGAGLMAYYLIRLLVEDWKGGAYGRD